MTRTSITLALTVILFVLSIALLWPTWTWYRMPADERAAAERAKDRILSRILNLGLDLRGGTHLVLELDPSKLDPKLSVQDALDRAIEIIRNRVDQFGVAEPLIARQGERWIVVQLPGIKDPEAAKELIGKTALLEFKMVDDSGVLERLAPLLRENKLAPAQVIEAQKNGALPSAVTKEIPAGWMLAVDREGRLTAVEKEPALTGSTLVNAKVELGGHQLGGYPSVALEFNSEGAEKFARVTEANVGKNLAILLDGVVQSAPVIRTAIPDGRAVIEGSFSAEEAKLLATVLRAGALPAPVRVIEERTVGPSLGEDSIRTGMRACLIGALLVFAFMAFYYKTSGLIADLALLINLVLTMAGMAYFHATLTLPGIAGLSLSLAMAVDANVLILERIREELNLGKTIRLAVDLGYERAFSAILDGNLTTFIAALFMFQFGTGPIRGFAVTLTMGLLISMFTAILFTHMVYDYWLGRSLVQRLSI